MKTVNIRSGKLARRREQDFQTYRNFFVLSSQASILSAERAHHFAVAFRSPRDIQLYRGTAVHAHTSAPAPSCAIPPSRLFRQIMSLLSPNLRHSSSQQSPRPELSPNQCSRPALHRRARILRPAHPGRGTGRAGLLRSVPRRPPTE